MTSANAIVVFVTCADAEEAAKLADSLLEQRLVACATVGAPVQSRYVWQGESQQSSEVPLTLKTRLDRYPAVEAAIRRQHSYATPEIIAVPVIAGSADYLQWIDASLD